MEPNQCQLECVAGELEALRCFSASLSSKHAYCRQAHLQLGVFSAACRELLWSLPGNSNCVDCGQSNPEWANVSFGTLLCIECSGLHRSYGVNVSVVRSIHMDSWTHLQVLNMLEGGNDQLKRFFERHQMHVGTVKARRYHTKGAFFYRAQLAKHVERVASMGRYQGRAATRQQHFQQPAESQRGLQCENTYDGSLSAMSHCLNTVTTAATADSCHVITSSKIGLTGLTPQSHSCRRSRQQKARSMPSLAPQQTINAL